jgi:DNA-binding LytR/AlgR family response regulator
MQIAICDDEPEQARGIKRMVESWAKAEEVPISVNLFGSAESFLFSWPEEHFDLALLDIQMKEMSGLQLAERIRKSDSVMSIVFLTGLTQFMLHGYDVNALHYLVKPVSPAKLSAVLDKAHALCVARKRDFIVAEGADGADCSVPLLSVSYISMDAHYADIRADGGAYRLRATANELERELPPYFSRCYRSIIVNMHRVEFIRGDTLGVSGGETLPVSRKYRKSVHEAFISVNGGIE